MDKIDHLGSAMDAMTETEADTLKALAQVDMAHIVARIEQDCLEGDMSAGQRKSAHLLLSYYAPKKATISQSNQSLTPLDSLSIESILAMMQMIDANIINRLEQGDDEIGSNTIQVVDMIDENNSNPSHPAFDSMAGGEGSDQVVSVHPRTDAVLASARRNGKLL